MNYIAEPTKTKSKSKSRSTRRKTSVVISVPHKSPGTAALIAFVCALFGFGGIGHIYVGRVGRGLVILATGFILYALIWITFLGGLIGGAATWLRGGLGVMQASGTTAVAIIFAYAGLMIWQILDARESAKKYNEQAENAAVSKIDDEPEPDADLDTEAAQF